MQVYKVADLHLLFHFYWFSLIMGPSSEDHRKGGSLKCGCMLSKEGVVQPIADVLM